MTDRDATTRDGARRVADPAGQELGGDPACWLNRVCQDCGRFIDDPRAETCPTCGAPRESAR